jgi:hypothetical protein
MKLRATLPVIALILSLSLNASAAQTDQGYPKTAGHYNARVKWLKEARFGMFIHWGVYGVASGEWKGRYYGSGGEWIERIASIPLAEYKALGKDFAARSPPTSKGKTRIQDRSTGSSPMKKHAPCSSRSTRLSERY